MDIFTAKQIVNNAVFILDLELIAIIAAHFYREFRDADTFSYIYNRLGNKVAIGVLVHMIGLAIVRWDRIYDYQWSDHLWPFLGTALSMFGILCLIRIFTPTRWGAWAWIGSPLLAAAFVWLTV